MRRYGFSGEHYRARIQCSKIFETLCGQHFAAGLSHFELILVDDGSEDDSGRICDAYAVQDGRIRVFHQENAGVSAARNRALDMAEGEYVQFLDSDDWIAPEATRLLVEHAI